jgi:ABC-type glycerol-3-phosphate transport system substrate-binding protein
MRYKILTAILVVSLPLFLAACTLKDIPVIGTFFGGNTVVANLPVTLNVWGLWESPEVMDTLIQKYKTLHPDVTINYDNRSVVAPSLYKDTVKGRLSQAGVPDVVVVHNSWVSEIKDYLSPAPASLITPEVYSQHFYPVSSQSAVIDGKIYAVPMYYDGLVLAYNKKHFEEINQTTPPTAWEEFRRLALDLTQTTKDGVFVRSGAAIGTADNIDFFSDILGLMFAQAGIKVPDDLSSKAAQDALAFYITFVKEDKIWDNSLPEASKAFAQGKVSMIFTTTWNLLDIIKANPSLDIGVAPVPQALPDTPISWGSFWMYAVPKNGQNTDAAWQFINFLTQDEQQLALFDQASKFRAYGAPYSSVVLAPQVASGPSAQFIKPVLDTAPFAVSGYFAGRSGNAFQVDALKTAVNSVLLNSITPAQALNTLKATLQRGNTPTPTQ